MQYVFPVRFSSCPLPRTQPTPSLSTLYERTNERPLLPGLPTSPHPRYDPMSGGLNSRARCQYFSLPGEEKKCSEALSTSVGIHLSSLSIRISMRSYRMLMLMLMLLMMLMPVFLLLEAKNTAVGIAPRARCPLEARGRWVRPAGWPGMDGTQCWRKLGCERTMPPPSVARNTRTSGRHAPGKGRSQQLLLQQVCRVHAHAPLSCTRRSPGACLQRLA